MAFKEVVCELDLSPSRKRLVGGSCQHTWSDNKVRELTAVCCCGSSGQNPQYGLMTLAYQRFTVMLLLIHGNLFLSGGYYCLSVFWCAVMRMSELIVKLSKSGSKIREMLMLVYGNNAMKITVVYKWVTCFSEGRES
jgi:hypothetical protein